MAARMQAMMAVIECTRKPAQPRWFVVIFSHSQARTIAPTATRTANAQWLTIVRKSAIVASTADDAERCARSLKEPPGRVMPLLLFTFTPLTLRSVHRIGDHDF